MAMMLLLCSCTAASKNSGAIRYQNDSCVVFYPDNDTIKEYARSLCEDGQDRTIDFDVVKKGDFRLVSYPNGLSFFTEEDYSDPLLEVKEGKDILSSELRYQMKKDDIDLAYTSGFILDTREDVLNTDDVTVRMDNDRLLFYFPQYDYEVDLSLSLGQSIVGRDFGLDRIEYQKKRYIDPERPMVALTFDDGPYKKVDSIIYDVMEMYDARCTFYFVGSRLSQTELEHSMRGIALGCEYGSHTENHEDLEDLSAYDARDRIYDVSDYFYEKTGYQMKTYRPPFGNRNREMEDIIDMTSILWNVDSMDWNYRDSDITYENVISYTTPGDVVLMHSLYESTADALWRIVPVLMDEGYQLVTVSELMENLGVDSRIFGGR